MNILITAPNLNPAKNVSGISTVVNTIIENNIQHRYFHYLLGRSDKPINRIGWFWQLIKQLLVFPFFAKKRRITLVHQNLPFDPKGLLREYIINVWCRMLHLPVVLHVHGGEFLMNGTRNPIYCYIAKSLFKYSKKVVVLSEIEHQALQDLYAYDSSTVLANSIDVAKYRAENKTLNQSKPTLLFLGRIHESKGVEDLVAALELLKKEKEFRFLLCGAGPLQDKICKSLYSILGNDFEYRGIVSGETKIEVIKEADFFLLPSRYGEGLPMALLETMSAGVVPLVTDDASMKYVVQHNINGIRVNKKDSQDIYEKLLLIINNCDLHKKISDNARKTVCEQYDITNYIIKLNNIYNSIKK